MATDIMVDRGIESPPSPEKQEPIPERSVDIGEYNITLSGQKMAEEYGFPELPGEDFNAISGAVKVVDIARKNGWVNEYDELIPDLIPEGEHQTIDEAIKVRELAMKNGFLNYSDPEAALDPMMSYASNVLDASTFGLGGKVMPYFLAGLAKGGQFLGLMEKDPNTLKNMQESYGETKKQAEKTSPGLALTGTIAGAANPVGGFSKLFELVRTLGSASRVAKTLGISIKDAHILMKTLKNPSGKIASPTLKNIVSETFGGTSKGISPAITKGGSLLESAAETALATGTYGAVQALGEGKAPKEVIETFGQDAVIGAAAHLGSEIIRTGVIGTATKGKEIARNLYTSARGKLSPETTKIYQNKASRKILNEFIEDIPANKENYTNIVNSEIKTFETESEKAITDILSSGNKKTISLENLNRFIDKQVNKLKGEEYSEGVTNAIKRLESWKNTFYSVTEPAGKILDPKTGKPFIAETTEAKTIPAQHINKIKKQLYQEIQGFYKEWKGKVPEQVDRYFSKIASHVKKIENGVAGLRTYKGKGVHNGKTVSQINSEYGDIIAAKTKLGISNFFYGDPKKLGWTKKKFTTSTLKSGRRTPAAMDEAEAVGVIDRYTKAGLGDKIRMYKAAHELTDPEVISNWYNGRSLRALGTFGAVGSLVGYLTGDWRSAYLYGAVGALGGQVAMMPALTKPILGATGLAGRTGKSTSKYLFDPAMKATSKYAPQISNMIEERRKNNLR